MPNKIMKTLTINGTTYEIYDANARADIVTIKQNIENLQTNKFDSEDIDTTFAIEGKLVDAKLTGDRFFEVEERVTRIEETLPDTTLTIEERAADAKAVGDKFTETIETLTETDNAIEEKADTAQATADEAIILAESKVAMIPVSVLLPVTGWDEEKRQEVTVEGVTANSIIMVSPSVNSLVNYALDAVCCVEQSVNTLIFQCEFIPSVTLTVNVVVFNNTEEEEEEPESDDGADDGTTDDEPTTDEPTTDEPTDDGAESETTTDDNGGVAE